MTLAETGSPGEDCGMGRERGEGSSLNSLQAAFRLLDGRCKHPDFAQKRLDHNPFKLNLCQN